MPAAMVNCRTNSVYDHCLSVVIHSNYPGIGRSLGLSTRLTSVQYRRHCRVGCSGTAYIMYARGASEIYRRPLAEAEGSDYGQVGVTSLQYTQSETDGKRSEALQQPSIPPDTCCQLNPSKPASGLFCRQTRNRRRSQWYGGCKRSARRVTGLKHGGKRHCQSLKGHVWINDRDLDGWVIGVFRAVELCTQLHNYFTGVQDCSMATLDDSESMVHHLILNQKVKGKLCLGKRQWEWCRMRCCAIATHRSVWATKRLNVSMINSIWAWWNLMYFHNHYLSKHIISAYCAQRHLWLASLVPEVWCLICYESQS